MDGSRGSRECGGVRSWPRSFRALATAPGCPPFDLMSLALAREFGEVDDKAALDRLEDLGRAVFGIAQMDPIERIATLAAALTREFELTASDRNAEDLDLDRVLARGHGHPALLGVAYVEAARRAGVDLKLFSGRCGWLVGEMVDDGLVVVDPGTGLDPPEPERVFPLRHHCAHELAFCVLGALARRLAAAGSPVDARSALELRLELPIDQRLRQKLSEGLEGRGD